MKNTRKYQNGAIQYIAIPIGILVTVLLLWGIISTLLFAATYHDLTKEGYIATLWFKPVNSNNLEYTVEYSFDKTPTKYHEGKIYGDQWRIDAQFEKRPYLLSAIFGTNPKYAVSRIEGRYSNSTDENSMRHLAIIINKDSKLAPFSIFGWAPFVDVNYGSSVYDNIDTKKIYTVIYTQTGLICRTSDMPNDPKDESLLNEIKNLF